MLHSDFQLLSRLVGTDIVPLPGAPLPEDAVLYSFHVCTINHSMRMGDITHKD